MWVDVGLRDGIVASQTHCDTTLGAPLHERHSGDHGTAWNTPKLKDISVIDNTSFARRLGHEITCLQCPVILFNKDENRSKDSMVQDLSEAGKGE